MPAKQSSRRPRRLRAAVAFTIACGLLIAVNGVAAPAGADETITPVKIGKAEPTPKPLCPQRPAEKKKPTVVKRPCFVMGKLTGFQLRVGKHRNVMKAKQDGKIVAWSVYLAHPNKFERKVFSTKFFPKPFDGAPSARIGILKKKKGVPKFKLLRQSPAVILSSSLGQKTVLTLDKPLRIKAGQIVALTTQTWVPAFTTRTYSPDSRWQASRSKGLKPKNCGQGSPKTRPQTKVGSERRYDCIFTDRLLYWAYEVPKGS